MKDASFNALLEWVMATRQPGDPVWRYNSKTAGRDLAARAGLRVPKLLAGSKSIRDITPPAGAFVVKPVNGSSSRGVLPLVRDGDGFLNMFTGETKPWGLWAVDALASKGSSGGHPDEVRNPWIVEEAILGPAGLAYDWKFWVIGGEPLIAWQCDHNMGNGRSRAVKWWTPEWDDAGDAAPHRVLHLDPELPAPTHPDELLAAAAAVGREVESPFIRVDLYEDTNGPVFGEITPHPFGGTIPFGKKWDRILGEAWLAAGREAEGE